MSANWGDGDGMASAAPAIPAAAPAPAPRAYKRMVLTKRTVAAPVAATTTRSSIFGSAKPREQVLREKGIDVKAVERKLDERTQRLPRMNKAQEEEFLELEQQLASAKKRAEAEDATVDAKAEAEAEVAKLTKERSEFIEARKKEEQEYAKKRREQARADDAAAGAAGQSGRDGGGSYQRSGGNYNNRDRDSGPGGFPSRGGNSGFSRGGNSSFSNDNGADFSNFESRRNRDGNRDGNRDSGAGGSSSFGGSFGSSSRPRTTGGSSNGAKLFVGQLNFATTAESLQEAFANFGTVVDCVVIMNRQTGQSKGFGFVTLGDAAQAQAAMQGLDGAQVDGRPIIVKPSQ